MLHPELVPALPVRFALPNASVKLLPILRPEVANQVGIQRIAPDITDIKRIYAARPAGKTKSSDSFGSARIIPFARAHMGYGCLYGVSH